MHPQPLELKRSSRRCFSISSSSLWSVHYTSTQSRRMAQPGILLLLACALCLPGTTAYRAEVNIFAPKDKLPPGVPPQTRPIPVVFGGGALTDRDQLRYQQMVQEQQKAKEMRRLGVDEYR